MAWMLRQAIAGIVLYCGLSGAAEPETAAAITAGHAVSLQVDVEGDLFASAAAESEAVRRPIKLEARFDFLERPAPAAGAADVARRYRIARAEIETQGQRAIQNLASDARELVVTLEGTTPKPFLEEGYLSRDEADLLDVPFDPLLVDGLKPAQPVSEGNSWKLPGDLVAGLLAIDTVESGHIEAKLMHVADDRATIRFEGSIVGAADGAPTRIQVMGEATAAVRTPDENPTPVESRDQDGRSGEDDGPDDADSPDAASWAFDGPIEGLKATITERREAGWVAPGLDVRATITMSRSPADEATVEVEADRVADGLAAALADRPAGKGRPGVVWQRHRQGRYSAVLDARWRVVEDGPEGLVLRLSDRGKLVAQCSILPLPRVAADAPPAEQAVREDVRRSLGDQFGLLTGSEASTREDGTRIVRVVAEGAADGRAFRWIHYVLTDPAGHRLAVTFMHEPGLVDRFAAADRELIAGVALLPDPPPRQAGAPQEATR